MLGKTFWSYSNHVEQELDGRLDHWEWSYRSFGKTRTPKPLLVGKCLSGPVLPHNMVDLYVLSSLQTK